jgi:hypothetical protein
MPHTSLPGPKILAPITALTNQRPSATPPAVALVRQHIPSILNVYSIQNGTLTSSSYSPALGWLANCDTIGRWSESSVILPPPPPRTNCETKPERGAPETPNPNLIRYAATLSCYALPPRRRIMEELKRLSSPAEAVEAVSSDGARRGGVYGMEAR